MARITEPSNEGRTGYPEGIQFADEWSPLIDELSNDNSNPTNNNNIVTSPNPFAPAVNMTNPMTTPSTFQFGGTHRRPTDRTDVQPPPSRYAAQHPPRELRVYDDIWECVLTKETRSRSNAAFKRTGLGGGISSRDNQFNGGDGIRDEKEFYTPPVREWAQIRGDGSGQQRTQALNSNNNNAEQYTRMPSFAELTPTDSGIGGGELRGAPRDGGYTGQQMREREIYGPPKTENDYNRNGTQGQGRMGSRFEHGNGKDRENDRERNNDYSVRNKTGFGNYDHDRGVHGHEGGGGRGRGIVRGGGGGERGGISNYVNDGESGYGRGGGRVHQGRGDGDRDDRNYNNRDRGGDRDHNRDRGGDRDYNRDRGYYGRGRGGDRDYNRDRGGDRGGDRDYDRGRGGRGRGRDRDRDAYGEGLDQYDSADDNGYGRNRGHNREYKGPDTNDYDNGRGGGGLGLGLRRGGGLGRSTIGMGRGMRDREGDGYGMNGGDFGGYNNRGRGGRGYGNGGDRDRDRDRDGNRGGFRAREGERRRNGDRRGNGERRGNGGRDRMGRNGNRDDNRNEGMHENETEGDNGMVEANTDQSLGGNEEMIDQVQSWGDFTENDENDETDTAVKMNNSEKNENELGKIVSDVSQEKMATVNGFEEEAKSWEDAGNSEDGDAKVCSTGMNNGTNSNDGNGKEGVDAVQSWGEEDSEVKALGNEVPPQKLDGSDGGVSSNNTNKGEDQRRSKGRRGGGNYRNNDGGGRGGRGGGGGGGRGGRKRGGNERGEAGRQNGNGNGNGNDEVGEVIEGIAEIDVGGDEEVQSWGGGGE